MSKNYSNRDRSKKNGQGLGASAGGAIFDHTGSYHLAVITVIPLFILFALFFWIMGPKKMRRIITTIPCG